MSLRERPDIESIIIGNLLFKDDHIEIIDRSEPMQIMGMNAPWYKIRTEDGREGWSYGWFISVEP